MKKGEGRKVCLGRNGGEGGIRTPGGVTPTSDFESGAFNHSATSPRGNRGRKPIISEHFRPVCPSAYRPAYEQFLRTAAPKLVLCGLFVIRTSSFVLSSTALPIANPQSTMFDPPFETSEIRLCLFLQTFRLADCLCHTSRCSWSHIPRTDLIRKEIEFSIRCHLFPLRYVTLDIATKHTSPPRAGFALSRT